jgi:hypothetical protein
MRGGRLVTNARRDAVDAEVSRDERHSFVDGEAVWSQCRRFEVPAEVAANLRQELQIESGTGES